MAADKVRVLVVDDEPDIVSIIKDMFELFGFEVGTASSGNEALKKLADSQFDIIVSDVKMPDGSGIDLLKAVKNQDAYKPAVLFISGYTDLSLEEMMDLGVDGFFPKPFDATAIANAVRTALVDPNTRWSHPTSDEPKHKLTLQPKSVFSEKSPAQLGRGGLFLEWNQNFPAEREVVEFEIEVKDHVPVDIIKGLGRVSWVRRDSDNPELLNGVGLEIVHLDGICLKEVTSYIKDGDIKPFIPIGR